MKIKISKIFIFGVVFLFSPVIFIPLLWRVEPIGNDLSLGEKFTSFSVAKNLWALTSNPFIGISGQIPCVVGEKITIKIDANVFLDQTEPYLFEVYSEAYSPLYECKNSTVRVSTSLNPTKKNFPRFKKITHIDIKANIAINKAEVVWYNASP